MEVETEGQPTDDRYQMSPIQVACMDFCIELLNQRVGAKEYECALVCALAVLGRGRDRWRDAESYPPILSKMIKIGRFMVLHKALRLDPHAEQILDYMRDRHEVQTWSLKSVIDDAEYSYAGQDEGYGSDRTPTRSSSPSSCAASSPAFEPVRRPSEPMHLIIFFLFQSSELHGQTPYEIYLKNC
ncbi:uncharacterized protein PFLUO_LOCUS8 [Penicillium psychrofluorescens]|uniref:uncharacterized protein n=1 Tax=Penicillium psychrofluorescens TaxID=3158075 RepID=UPI003CCD378D